jgi:hypothetical protein
MGTKTETPMQGSKITVGLPGVVGAEIPVPRLVLSWLTSLFTWFTSLFSKPPVAELFVVPWMSAEISVSQDDDGTIFVYLSVLNKTGGEVQVRQLFLERISAGGCDLSIMAPMFTPPKDAILSLMIQTIPFRISIGAPAIRLLINVVQKAQNLRSTPRCELSIIGSLELVTKRKSFLVPFTVNCRPELHFHYPSANV